jgi:L-alanine-DL-glutamate epimerase-like enolase superfamily enzyme
MMKVEALIESVRASAFVIPTDRPEADGTIEWESTTLVIVEVVGGGQLGLGYTYSSMALVALINNKLAQLVNGADAFDPPGIWNTMQRAIRNLGREGLVAAAISAIDTALYDLKARLLDLPLVKLLGACRGEIAIYGSGGFTTYSDDELCAQLADWVARDRCAFVKMKVGTRPDRDPHRVSMARKAIGDEAILFVDANGAYQLQKALQLAEIFSESGVGWFEEPVSSDDLVGLNALCSRAPAGMQIAAGEYAYTIDYVRVMLQAHAVHVQQADVTRCGGYTAFLKIAALCDAFHIPLSGHCAPALHLHAACAVQAMAHLEWFHDHVRIEQMLFDGAPVPHHGAIRPDIAKPGHGLTFKHKDAARYAVSAND